MNDDNNNFNDNEESNVNPDNNQEEILGGETIGDNEHTMNESIHPNIDPLQVEILDNQISFDLDSNEDIDCHNENSNENTHKCYYNSLEKENKSSKNNSFKFTSCIVATCLLSATVGSIAGGYFVSNKLNNETQNTSVSNVTSTPIINGNDNDIVAAIERVMPSVVGVSTKSLVANRFSLSEQEGIGSGFIISEDGLVVTNNHVIQGASDIKVILSTGEEVSAKIVNFDVAKDLALLQIESDIKMPGIATLGDSSNLKAGEDVIAIGNPLGKEYSKTVTKGIVSSPSRELEVSKDKTEHFIQTDAAINPGNSGGPLINSRGEVIGINTAKTTGVGIEGIGLSIPINIVKENLEVLKKPNLLIGISGRDIDEETAKQYDLEVGVYIVDIAPFGPAEKAKLRNGDVITKFNGKKIKSVEDLNKIKSTLNEGDSVEVTFVRDGKEMKTQIELTTR